MFKILIAFVFMMFSQFSVANSIDVNQMSVEQRAALLMQLSAAQTPVVEQRVDQWVDIGAKIARGIGAGAKELGVAVNEFSGTPVGKMTAVLLVWHILGEQIVDIFTGIFVWIIGISGIRYYTRKMYPINVKYHESEKNIFGNRVVISKKPDPMSGDAAFVSAIGMLLVLLVGGLIIAV